MSHDTFLALVSLALATLFTPGPNNAMLAASGANFGFARTIPHLVGVAAGFPLMLLIVGLLLGELFQASWLLREGLRWGGATLLLWMAWKIAKSAGTETNSTASAPMSLLGATAFQWINPKGWSMAVAASSQFVSPENPLHSALMVTATFMVLGFASAATWVGAGMTISRWLTSPARLRAFNLTMAGLIVLSTIALVRH